MRFIDHVTCIIASLQMRGEDETRKEAQGRSGRILELFPKKTVMILELIYSPRSQKGRVTYCCPRNASAPQTEVRIQVCKTALQPDKSVCHSGKEYSGLASLPLFRSECSLQRKKINQKTKNKKYKCKNII